MKRTLTHRMRTAAAVFLGAWAVLAAGGPAQADYTSANTTVRMQVDIGVPGKLEEITVPAICADNLKPAKELPPEKRQKFTAKKLTLIPYSLDGMYEAEMADDSSVLHDVLWTVKPETPGAPGQLSLVAQPEADATYGGKYHGFRLLLINRTGTDAMIATVGGLGIRYEAQDEKGRWRMIAAPEGCGCGTSADSKTGLPNDAYWSFRVPKYHGPLRTKLRFTMQQPDGTVLVSNEFEGFIHPGQMAPETKVAKK